MCNLYLMYYMDQGQASFEECMDEQDEVVSFKLPSDSDQALQPNAHLEMKAKGPGHHVGNPVAPPEQEDENGHHIKGHVLPPSSPSSDTHKITLTMPGAFPKEDDSYLCSGFRVKDWMNEAPVYITRFQVETTAQKVHHLIIQGCSAIQKPPGQIW